MESNSKRFLQSLALKASIAADEARLGLEHAGKAVAGKYDAARVSYDLTRIKAEQERIFADIGCAVFYMNTGVYKQSDDVIEPQQAIDSLILAAEQKQQEIDALQDRLSEISNTLVCPSCKHICVDNDAFCSSCGLKL